LKFGLCLLGLCGFRKTMDWRFDIWVLVCWVGEVQSGNTRNCGHVRSYEYTEVVCIKKVKKMKILRSIQEIKPLIASSELGEALNNLLIVTNILKFSDLHDELLLTKSRYSENKRNMRKGILRQDDYDLETNKIRNNIIEIYSDLEDMPDINSELRWGIKQWISAQGEHFEGIIVDYSKITNGEVGSIEFPPKDFKDVGDFLNAVYLEMYKFIPPFTYGNKWVLIDRNQQPINYTPVEDPSVKKDTRPLVDIFPYLDILFVEPIL
jgi:hypothetical protein